MANPLFQILKKDHQGVKELLGQLKESKESPVKKREELFRKLVEDLVPHMKAEETAFYKVLVDKEEAREDGLEAIEEHHVAEMVLKELQKLAKDKDQWAAKLSVFKELVEHHIQEEENTVFKSAEKALDDEEIEKITKRFEQEKQRIKKEEGARTSERKSA